MAWRLKAHVANVITGFLKKEQNAVSGGGGSRSIMMAQQAVDPPPPPPVFVQQLRFADVSDNDVPLAFASQHLPAATAGEEEPVAFVNLQVQKRAAATRDDMILEMYKQGSAKNDTLLENLQKMTAAAIQSKDEVIKAKDEVIKSKEECATKVSKAQESMIHMQQAVLAAMKSKLERQQVQQQQP